MGRFYFHILEGDDLVRDDEGSDLLDLSEARREALAAIREMVAEAVKFGKDDRAEALIIADSQDRVIEVVSFDTSCQFH
jgi:hypothetical protein